MNSTFPRFTSLTLSLRVLLIVHIISLTIGIISGLFEMQMVDGLINGDNISIEQIEINDSRQQIIGISQLVWFVLTGVVFLIWIHRAHSNLRMFGVYGKEFTPGWAVGWFFVPFANLVKPFQAMKELWQASHYRGDWRLIETPSLLGIWWGFWIISNIFGRIAGRLALRSETLEQIYNASLITLISDLIDIPLAVTAIMLVIQIHRMQEEYVRLTKLAASETPVPMRLFGEPESGRPNTGTL